MNFDGNKYFDHDSLRFAKYQSADSRAHLIYISPSEFLSVAMSGHSPEKLSAVREILDSGTLFNELPFLNFIHDGEGTAVVTAHEGRHRAKIMAEQGVTKIPVLLCHTYDPNGQPMVWKEISAGGGRFQDEWPRKLYGQRGGSPEADQHRYNSIDFPIPDLRIAKDADAEIDAVETKSVRIRLQKIMPL